MVRTSQKIYQMEEELTMWHGGGRGQGRGFMAHTTDQDGWSAGEGWVSGGEGGAGVARIMFAGNISAVNRVLANVTFEAGEAHVGRCEESLVGRVCRGFSA